MYWAAWESVRVPEPRPRRLDTNLDTNLDVSLDTTSTQPRHNIVRPSLTYVEVSRLVSRACRGCVEAMCRGYMCRGYALRLHLQDRTTHSICSSVSLQRLLPITKQLQDIALQTPGPACQLLAQAIGLTQYTFSYICGCRSPACVTQGAVVQTAMQNLQMHFLLSRAL